MKFGDDEVGRQHLISEEWDSHREKERKPNIIKKGWKQIE